MFDSYEQMNTRPPRIEPTNMFQGLIAGVCTAVVFGVGGFFLIEDRSGSMGNVLFMALPFVTGFATALVARRWNIVLASLIIGLIFASTVLLLTRKEGWVCVLMSAPLIVVGLGVGALLGVLARLLINKVRRPNVITLVLLLVLPLFLTGASEIEKPVRRLPRAETFTSVLRVNATPDKVWNAVKTMDRVDGHKGFLMRIGLPVPVRCEVDKEAVGGTRTCYFETGYIQERITEWDPPHSMKLEITSWDIPGRPWLAFRDASYELHVEKGQTVMTRTSTIISRLLPATYWRRFEEIGVTTEHEYLFEAIRNRLDREK